MTRLDLKNHTLVQATSGVGKKLAELWIDNLAAIQVEFGSDVRYIGPHHVFPNH
jgi:hypothetical protein